MDRVKYYSSRVTNCSANWQELSLADDYSRAFKSILIINDDGALELQIKLNEETNDILYIPASEGCSLDKEVYRIFYCAASGSPDFRVVAD